jgi:penicillin-binding protein 1C
MIAIMVFLYNSISNLTFFCQFARELLFFLRKIKFCNLRTGENLYKNYNHRFYFTSYREYFIFAIMYNLQLHLFQFFDIFRTKKAKKNYLRIAIILGVFFIANYFFPLPEEPIYSQIITAKKGEVLTAFLSPDEKWRMKTELQEITPELQQAFIAKEDKYFYYHLGINPLAIARAAFNNVIRGKKTSGASTITMQVARLLEPKERTYTNKLIEVFRALQLEWKYSKVEILQLYLNLVPYGSNIEGVKAASILYFNRLPNQLSVAQITTLTIIPNRPTSLAIGKHNERIEKERNKWLQTFANEKVFSQQIVNDAIAEPLNAKRQKTPKNAIHFAYWLHQKYPLKHTIPTFIRADIQAKTEEIAKTYMRSIQHFGIYNAAILVVENSTREVCAYVGSTNFEDEKHAGQVDGVRAYRSPGSALKPLVYGLAFDRGLITPKMNLIDVPKDFNGYMPENYNRKFNGYVTAEKALAASLNLPAVELLNQISVDSLVKKMQLADFEWVAKRNKNLGLSLALGGCGVSLAEMAGLYVSFANEGSYLPLNYVVPQPQIAPQAPEGGVETPPSGAWGAKLLSPAANYVIAEILTKVERPAELPNSYEHNPHLPKIAWKTGTSYGRRDAWSIGFNKKYTIAVWVGNFNGEGRPELTGASIATPLLFKLFNNLDYNGNYQWFDMPKNLDYRLVCTKSGKSPNAFCENLTSDAYLPSISHADKCEHAKYVYVSPDEKMSYCMKCLPENHYKQQLYPNLPPEMLMYYDQNQIDYVKIPPHNPNCTQLFEGEPPRIISPSSDREYFTDNEQVELLLQAQTTNEVKKVYWYIDDKFYKTATPNSRIFFKPQRGKIKISCSDDRGRNSDVWVWVK